MSDFLLLAVIFLAAGVVAVPIATRLGLGSVLGYLLAGVAISPILSLLHVDVVAIQHFAEFGVVMMLFLVGLELEPKRLWELRARLLGLGGGQVVLTTAAVAGIAMAFDLSWKVSLAVGMIFALSSTAIVLQSLSEKGLLRSEGGQASFSVLLFQDIAVIPMLALFPLLAAPELADLAVSATHSGDSEHTNLSLVDNLNDWQTAIVTAVAVALVVLGGNYLTRPVFRFISTAELRELFTAAALLMVVGIALLMNLVGLSAALGTFLAGVVLSSSEYRHELESDINPFKGLLLGVFFITVGAGIDFQLLYDNWMVVLGSTFALIVLKTLLLLVLGFVFRIPWASRWLCALALAQAGEFGFVLLAFSTANNILPDALADLLLLIVALSMLVTPLLFILYSRVIEPRFMTDQVQASDHIDEPAKIIIAGRGRMGGLIDIMLSCGGYSSTVIDYSSSRLDMVRKFGFHAYFGDAARHDLLHAAGIENAKLLVVAIDDKEQITALVKYACANFPNLHVTARAVDRDHVYQLWSLGCRDIVRETYDGALRMGRSAYEALGASRAAADEIRNLFDQADRENMIEAAEAYDVNVPMIENELYIAKVRAILDQKLAQLTVRFQEILEKDRQH